jgi:hypothetical protein
MRSLTKRNFDGTFRNVNKPRKTTVRTMRARRVEAEGLRLKQMGMSYEAIAGHITAVGRGLKPPAIALLDGVTFPSDYRISKVSVYLAVKAALAAAPQHEAEEYRQLQTDRCEELLFALQPGIRAGSPFHVSSAVKVLQHQADLQGLITTGPNPSLQAFQININLGETPVEPQQDAIETSSSPRIDDEGDE